MRIINFNSVGGASGDMTLGALIGLGVDIDTLNKELSTLLPGEEFEIKTESVTSHGIGGIRATVDIRKESHHHRHLNTIREIINSSALPAKVKTMSIGVFETLAEAEAKVHSTEPEKIHFHEVGAVDSIVDIAGCCLAIELLGAEKITVCPLPIGKGTFKCQHGVMPIPAPATVELLKGLEVIQTDEPFELVTPTGAALFSSWEKASGKVSGKIVASANSFGQRELNNRPNLLRAVMIDTSGKDEGCNCDDEDSCIVLETNIDDCSPEFVGALFDKLFDCGALDVFTTSALMKKQRPGILLSVLCREGNKEVIQNLIFCETSSFGIRETRAKRKTLPRRIETVETEFGEVGVKIGVLNGRDITFSPEFDDCLKISNAKKIPVKDVYNAALLKAMPHK